MAGLMVSCMGMEKSDPSLLQIPQVKTFEVKDNGSLVFDLKASVDKNIAGRIAECGFYYGKDKSLNDANKIECQMLGGSFSADVTLREYGETFYACSYISNGTDGNEVCSEVRSIAVKTLGEYVEFTSPFLMSYNVNSARVSVEYKVADGVDVTESGVCYGKMESLSIDQDSVSDVDGVAELIDLEAGESYYVCSYIKDGDYVAYSKSVPFSVYGIPVVVTGKEPQTDPESASLSGAVEDDCGKNVTERGFLWCEGVVEGFDVSKNTKVKCGVGVGEFEYTLTDLQPNTTYSYCAYAVNAQGAAYGDVKNFTTLATMPSIASLSSDSYEFIYGNKLLVTFSILSDGGVDISDAGVFISCTGGLGDAVRYSGSRVGSSVKVECADLQPASVYYVWTYAENIKGMAVSDDNLKIVTPTSGDTESVGGSWVEW